MSDHQEQLHEELEHIRVALDQMASDARQPASEARGPTAELSTGPARATAIFRSSSRSRPGR